MDLCENLYEALPDKQAIEHLLSTEGPIPLKDLCEKACRVRNETLGNKVYLRGLIEFSNQCAKNCLYCGIRSGNKQVERYRLTSEDVLKCVRLAHALKLGNSVLQSGENQRVPFVHRITALIYKIHEAVDPPLRLTLSLGEQSENVYREWHEAGAHRYLLRLETSNAELYRALHPADGNHTYQNRLDCLKNLRDIGYQTGTGVMIGLPGQTIGHLAEDLLTIRALDVDMVGMGPYVEHPNTPLYEKRDALLPATVRLELALRMIAVLRLLMPTINIVASTALDTLHPNGRLLGLKAGANVIMPNLTPYAYRLKYTLYEKKDPTNETIAVTMQRLMEGIQEAAMHPAFNEYGDAAHYINRTTLKHQPL